MVTACGAVPLQELEARLVRSRLCGAFDFVIQPTHPSVGDGSHDYILLFSTLQHTVRKSAPLCVVAIDESMRKLDEYLPQGRIASFDKPSVRLSRATRSVSRGDTAKTRQLLASVESIETPDFGSQGHRRYEPHAIQGQKLVYERVVGNDRLDPFLGLGDFLLKKNQL